MELQSPRFYNNKKLPKHILKDGAKWLMLPSKIVLDGLSAWPENQNAFTTIIHIYWFLNYFISIVGNYFYMSRKQDDLGAIAFSLSLITVSIEAVARRFLAYYYSNNLSKVLARIYFEFWPSDFTCRSLHAEFSKRSLYLFFYCSTIMMCAFLCGMQYLLIPYFSRDLPWRGAFPFQWQESPYYELLYVWQSFTVVESACNVCGFDLFFVSLLFNCVVQFRLLRNFLVENFEKAVSNTNGFNAEAEKVLILVIEQHKKLIGVCKEINTIFTYFILTQYLASIGTVCLSSFVATVVPKDIGQAFTYLMGHICEIFIYCYMGNDLIFESTELSNAVFQCGWHLAQGNKNLQKSLIMIMIRSQKPVRISAGGFGYLSLSSFVKLIQFSFSVYTLLNSLLQKQTEIIKS